MSLDYRKRRLKLNRAHYKGRLDHGRGGVGEVRRIQDGVPAAAAQRILRVAQGGGVVSTQV